MLVITKIFRFEAAHRLDNHEGKCKQLHGHSYKFEVTIAGNINPITGMVLDFGDLKDIVNNCIIEKLDHQYINTLPFCTWPATAENLVIWIAKELKLVIDLYDVDNSVRRLVRVLQKVRLYETEDSYVEWIRHYMEGIDLFKDS
jgi:6-pyruvoyltetrahydropterin/6-carboxytetrahydropterin synthase